MKSLFYLHFSIFKIENYESFINSMYQKVIYSFPTYQEQPPLTTEGGGGDLW